MTETVTEKEVRQWGNGILRAVLACLLLAVCLGWPIETQAATSSQEAKCRAEMLQMFYDADDTTHNIYQYKMTFQEISDMYFDLKAKEGQIIMSAYNGSTTLGTTSRGGYVSTIRIKNIDSDVMPRYERMKNNIETILAGIQDDMTDLDKVIYLHDELVELVSYADVGKNSYCAGGALGNKVAVCSGYALGLNILLNQAGIETDYVSSSALNHAWTYVKLDGEWYHIDATWDDTRSSVRGQTSHNFLLRNDDEFSAAGGNSHVKWTPKKITETADSQRFIDWYVHGIVGDMYFYDGYWYYVDLGTNSLMRNTAEGAEPELMLAGGSAGTLDLLGIDQGIVKFTLGTKAVSLAVEELATYDVDAGTETEPVAPETGTGTDAETGTEAETGSVDEATMPVDAVEACDFLDFSNWRSGCYYWTNGKYIEYAQRLCLTEYKTIYSDSYKIWISDTNYLMLIRELDANQEFLCSVTVKNGDTYIPGENAEYLAIGIYKTGWENVDYTMFQKMFAEGFYAQMEGDGAKLPVIVPEEGNTEEAGNTETPDTGNTETPDTSETPETENAETPDTAQPGSIEACDLADFSNWRSGCYYWTNGKYIEYAQRLCLTEYKTVNSDSYQVQITGISDTNFRMLIRELDENQKFLRSVTLMDGDTYVPSEKTRYVAIGIYRYGSENVDYAKYQEMFDAGFYVGLEAIK